MARALLKQMVFKGFRFPVELSLYFFADTRSVVFFTVEERSCVADMTLNKRAYEFLSFLNSELHMDAASSSVETER